MSDNMGAHISTIAKYPKVNQTTPAQAIQQAQAAGAAIQSDESGYYQDARGVQSEESKLNQAMRDYVGAGGSTSSVRYKDMENQLAQATKYLNRAREQDEPRVMSTVNTANALLNEIGQEFGQVGLEYVPRSPGARGGGGFNVATGNSPGAVSQNLADAEGYVQELRNYLAQLRQTRYLRSAQGIRSTFDQIYQDFHIGKASGNATDVNDAMSVALKAKNVGTISSTMYEDLAQMATQTKQIIKEDYAKSQAAAAAALAGFAIPGSGQQTSGTGQAGSGQAVTGQAGAGQAGAGQAGAGQAGTVLLGAGPSSTATAGTAQSGPTQSGSAQSGSAQSGSAQSGSTSKSGASSANKANKTSSSQQASAPSGPQYFAWIPQLLGLNLNSAPSPESESGSSSIPAGSTPSSGSLPPPTGSSSGTGSGPSPPPAGSGSSAQPTSNLPYFHQILGFDTKEGNEIMHAYKQFQGLRSSSGTAAMNAAQTYADLVSEKKLGDYGAGASTGNQEIVRGQLNILKAYEAAQGIPTSSQSQTPAPTPTPAPTRTTAPTRTPAPTQTRSQTRVPQQSQPKAPQHHSASTQKKTS